MNYTQSPAVKQLYTKYLTVVLKGKRPSPYQSVKDIQWLLADLIPGAGRAALAIEIKNYLIQNQDAFIRSLQKQVARRVQQRIGGISPPEQKVILDMRGQPATWNQLNQLARRVARETGLAPKNVSVVTW